MQSWHRYSYPRMYFSRIRSQFYQFTHTRRVWSTRSGGIGSHCSETKKSVELVRFAIRAALLSTGADTLQSDLIFRLHNSKFAPPDYCIIPVHRRRYNWVARSYTNTDTEAYIDHTQVVITADDDDDKSAGHRRSVCSRSSSGNDEVTTGN